MKKIVIGSLVAITLLGTIAPTTAVLANERLDSVEKSAEVYTDFHLDEDLKNKVGLIFEYEHLFFSLTSDLPESKIILPKGISEDNIAFISTIYYGKFGYLFVETDLDNKVEIKSILNKFANKEVLTSKENEIINASNFGYLKPGIDKYDFIKGIGAINNFYKDSAKQIGRASCRERV